MKKLWKLNVTPYKSGQIAEWLCRMYMRLRGYRIIAKNYHCGSGRNTPFGELDFVALKGRTLFFCEVKKRKKFSNFLFALSTRQKLRIMRGAEYFIKHHPQYRRHTMQFDVFFVQLPFYIRRIKNALYCDNIR